MNCELVYRDRNNIRLLISCLQQCFLVSGEYHIYFVLKMDFFSQYLVKMSEEEAVVVADMAFNLEVPGKSR